MLSVIQAKETLQLTYIGINIGQRKILAGINANEIVIEIPYNFDTNNIFEGVRGFNIDINQLQTIDYIEKEKLHFFYNQYYSSDKDKVLDSFQMLFSF